jgi:hypothetical protein
MALRKHERHEVLRKANWDFYSERTGAKSGYITNISKSGCLLSTSENIDHRRWIRVMLKDESTNVIHVLVGKIVRMEQKIHSILSITRGVGIADLSLYRYGIEFTSPSGALSDQDLDLILALSSKNLSVRSCLSLNTKSS